MFAKPLLNRILKHATKRPTAIAIRDDRANYEKTFLQLLSDTLALREMLQQALKPDTIKALDDGEEVYIAILAGGSYEFTVALLAVLAIGAAAVPLAVSLPVNEADYFIRKSKAVAVLAQSSLLELGSMLQRIVIDTSDQSFRCVPIQPAINSSPVTLADIRISSDRYLAENGPGLVIFTSGTTGPPKGAVMRRAFFSDNAIAIADHYGINEKDVMMHVLPVHHSTGIGIMFFPFLYSGACIEFRGGAFDEAWMWERWREGVSKTSRRITFFSGVPTIFMRLRRHYQKHLGHLPLEALSEYLAAARQFRVVLCGTSALPQPISQFWTKLMKGRIMQRYGATEIGITFQARVGDQGVPEGSAGELVPGLEVRLSEGDRGEVLVKSPYMFSKYLSDSDATRNAHDANGFYKTGDIARRIGKYYFILGRASLDIIKSGGYKISALHVEREILSLPYISEVMVVGVADFEYGQRVAALISLSEDLREDFPITHGSCRHILTLESLRNDLRSKLARYKLPTLLRVVDGEFPKTITGKVLKRDLGPKFFPGKYDTVGEVQVWRGRGSAPISSQGTSEIEPVVLAKL